MLIVGGYGHNVVNHLSDLFVFVVTFDDEAGKRGKMDCDESLHRNTASHVVQVSLYTADIVRQSQTCKTLGTV